MNLGYLLNGFGRFSLGDNLKQGFDFLPLERLSNRFTIEMKNFIVGNHNTVCAERILLDPFPNLIQNSRFNENGITALSQLDMHGFHVAAPQ